MTDGSASSIGIYNAQAGVLAARYEALDVREFRQTYADLLPESGPDRLALDVGAGSGRDAAWLAGLGFQAVAAEPAAGFREAAKRLRPDSKVRWLDDRLPALSACQQLGLAFDVILLSAVWQHVAPGDRRRAFRKLTALLKPKGLLIIILRFGPSPTDRPMHEVSVGEIEALAREHGLAVTRTTTPMPVRVPIDLTVANADLETKRVQRNDDAVDAWTNCTSKLLAECRKQD